MRVLMFGWEYPPYSTGGLATATLALANGIARMGTGDEVTLVVPFPADPSSTEGVRVISAADLSPSLRLVRIASPLEAYTTLPTIFSNAARRGRVELSPYRHTLFEDVEQFAAVAAELAAEYPHDVIHAHDWMTYPAGLAARAVSGKPLVAHVHATEFDRSGDWPNPDLMRREAQGLLDADRVIANSHATKRRIVERYGIPADQVDVVHWGIEATTSGAPFRARPPFGDDVPMVLFLGRIVLQKGPDYFIDAAARVHRLRDDVCFVVAGAGDMLPAIMDRAIDRGIAHRTFFTGGVSREEAQLLLRMASVCVMPSVSEPFGLVALESLVAGTPVIVSRAAGVAEAIANMMTVDFWDVDDIADKILAAVSDDALMTELRARGAEEIEDAALHADEPVHLTLHSYGRAIASPV